MATRNSFFFKLTKNFIKHNDKVANNKSDKFSNILLLERRIFNGKMIVNKNLSWDNVSLSIPSDMALIVRQPGPLVKTDMFHVLPPKIHKNYRVTHVMMGLATLSPLCQVNYYFY